MTKKKTTKEEMAKAKEELSKIKDEWQRLPKNGKIGTIVVAAVIVIAIFVFIFGNNELDNPVNNTASNNNSNGESVEPADVAEEKDTVDVESLPIAEYIVKTDNHVEAAELSNEGILTILLDASSSFSPKSVASTYVYWSFEAINKSFQSDEVSEVSIVIQAPLIDNQGNEEVNEVITYAYTRNDFNDLDYDNFLRLASGQEWRILNEAYAYFVHPAVFNEVDFDYQNNLSNRNSKVPLVEE
ncbi:hypothetical protein [Oceanobacillus sp. FSL W7-1293]|uniref:hypothetical protein n=1 Tax=Oceanobacillus sp. FSL W7-1293 TaxID=2921699 RepID=UPI0030CE8663